MNKKLLKMSTSDQIKALSEIHSSINSREIQIFTSLSKVDSINQEIEKFNKEIQALQKASEELKLENSRKEQQIQQYDELINFLNESLHTNIKSCRYLRNHNVLLKEIQEKDKEKFQAVYNTLEEQYNVHKANYESTNASFIKLSKSRVDLKKIKISYMLLEQQISDIRETNQQRKDIQSRIFYNKIVRFAESWLKYQKARQNFLTLTKLEAQEKVYAKKFLELQKKLKEQQKNRNSMRQPDIPRTIPKINFTDVTDSGPTNEKSTIFSEEQNRILKSIKSKDRIHCLLSQLQNEVSEVNKDKLPLKIQESTSFASTNNDEKIKKFNDAKSKVRILDVKILDPTTKPDSVAKEPLYGKFKQIVQNVKNKYISRSQLSEENYPLKANETITKSLTKMKSLNQSSQSSQNEIAPKVSQPITEVKQLKEARQEIYSVNKNVVLSQSKAYMMQEPPLPANMHSSQTLFDIKEELFSQMGQNSGLEQVAQNEINVPKINFLADMKSPRKSCSNPPENGAKEDKEKSASKKTVSFHPFDINISDLENSTREGGSANNTLELNFNDTSMEEKFSTSFEPFGPSSYQGFSFEPNSTSENNTESKTVFGFGGSFNMF